LGPVNEKGRSVKRRISWWHEDGYALELEKKSTNRKSLDLRLRGKERSGGMLTSRTFTRGTACAKSTNASFGKSRCGKEKMIPIRSLNGDKTGPGAKKKKTQLTGKAYFFASGFALEECG